MAPRRGGGGGGGGGGGSSIADTPWGASIPLPGRRFTDPYTTASVVFSAIGLIGIIIILIWASTFRKHHEPNKKLFRRSAFWLSAWALFVAFAIHFSILIIYEVADWVQQIFFLIVTIISQTAYLAEISLLAALYLLLPYCFNQLSSRADRPRMVRSLKIVHAVFIFILVAIWLSSMGLKINYEVVTVIGNPFVYRTIVRPYLRLDTAYSILYFLGTLEILAWSILALLNARKANEPGKLPLLLLTTIALPLLLRSTYSMGDTIYEELLTNYSNKRLFLATDIIYNLTTLSIYAGIVAIGRHFANTNLPPNYGPGHMNPSYDPNAWTGHGLPPHDSTKPNMAVQEGPPPPLYQQANFQPMPPYNGQQPHGTVQYSSHPPPPPPHQQPQMHIPYQQPYPNQYQQQHQQPYPNQGYQPYPQQPVHQPTHSPPPPQQMSPVSPIQRRPAPSEAVGGTAPATANELPSPTGTPHAFVR